MGEIILYGVVIMGGLGGLILCYKYIDCGCVIELVLWAYAGVGGGTIVWGFLSGWGGDGGGCMWKRAGYGSWYNWGSGMVS